MYTTSDMGYTFSGRFIDILVHALLWLMFSTSVDPMSDRCLLSLMFPVCWNGANGTLSRPEKWSPSRANVQYPDGCL